MSLYLLRSEEALVPAISPHGTAGLDHKMDAVERRVGQRVVAAAVRAARFSALKR